MISLSPTKLASEIDDLVTANSAVLVETPVHVVLARLAATDARHVGQSVLALGWSFGIEDNTQTECDLVEVGEDLAPYRLTLKKPSAPAGTIRILTRAGFEQWLSTDILESRIEVCPASADFETYRFVVCPWDGGADPVVRPEIKSPRKIVRETSSTRIVPEDVRPWLLEERLTPNWTDPVFQTWASSAAIALARSLCSEVTEDGQTLVFAGPPKLRTQPTAFALDRTGGRAGFSALQDAARWVFENDREVETRHRLFAMEVARSAPGDTTIPEIFTQNTTHLLEGARLAFQMGLEDLSKDTIKALTDLRKSLGDETAKLADGMRQIATAVAGAMFAGLGLVAARISGSAPRPIVIILATIILLYIIAIIASNIRYVYIQRSIRREWRGRIYRFLSEEDYTKMVTVPSDRAEGALFFSMALGGGLSLALFAGIILTS